MSLFDMQGMEAEDSKVRQDDNRSALSLLSAVGCADSVLSVAACA